MGERGPLAQPAQFRVITGQKPKTTGAQLTEALRPKVDIPDCPEFLLPDAVAEWDRIAPELKKLHIISQIDKTALAMYCQNYAIWAGLQRQIQARGVDGLIDAAPSGYKQVSALCVASAKAFEQMRSMLAEFGLSPLTRARIAPNICTNLDLFDDLPDSNDAPPEVEAKPRGTERFFNNSA